MSARHRARPSRLRRRLRLVGLGVAVLTGTATTVILTAGAIWLAVQTPGVRSANRVNWYAPAPADGPQPLT